MHDENLLLLLTGSSSVFYPVCLMCLFFCDVHVQPSHQRFEDRPDGLGMFGFLFSAIFGSRSSPIPKINENIFTN